VAEVAKVPAATIEVQLLGGFAVVGDGVAVTTPWRLRKARTLVKLLALAPGHRMHRDVLSDRLWPDADPAAAANNLHQALHAARRVLGPDRLVLRDEMLVLGPEGDVLVDVDTFTAAAAAADGSAASLAAALTSWTGDLLPEDLYEDWATPHREHLASTRTGVALRLAVALGTAGDPGGAASVLGPVAVDRPGDEEVSRRLFEALFAAGRRADGIAVFDRLRDALEDIGEVPSTATADLYRRLSTGGPSVPASVPHNLPAFATSFVGRRRELRALTSALDRTRLLTVIGPGGAGKTRLAVELARQRAALPRNADGVWLVDLAGVTDRSLVASAVASALGLSLAGGRPPATALVDQLTGRRLLLVLDNCEHLLSTVSPLAAEVLVRCPDVVVMATSREPLDVAGELAWRTPSLDLPREADAATPVELAAVESVHLFVDRAGAAAPAFVLDEMTAPAVVAICRRLDGIPLALELAAARLAHLSVHQVSDRLDDALAVLAGRRHGLLDRQQTLAATLDWSHDLLDEQERVAFRRLAVFAGGFDLDAADELSGVHQIIDTLGHLVDKSLVAADLTGAVARYRLHEVVRQYAEARLIEAGEIDDARGRHRAWFAGEAGRHDPDRGVPVVLEPSTWFDLEQDNLRAALVSAVRHDPCLGLQLATSTWRFWMSRGQIADPLTWLTDALRGCADVSPLRSRALFGTGVLHIRRGQIAPLLAVGEEIAAVERLIGHDVDRADATWQRAVFSLMAHDWQLASELSAEAVALASVDAAVAVSARQVAGLLALGVGELEAAAQHFAVASAALADVPRTAPPFFSVMSISCLTDARGEVPATVAEESMLLGRRVGTAQAAGYLAVATATVERLAGRVDAALGLLGEAIERFGVLGDVYGSAFAASQRAHTLRWTGDLDAAIQCFDQAEELRSSLRDVRAVAMTVAGRIVVDAMLGRGAAARQRAGEVVEGMRRTGDVPGTALTLNNAALVEALLGDDQAALPLLAESIATGAETLPIYAMGWQLAFRAQLLANVGDVDGSAAALRDAGIRFAALGDGVGGAAVLRPCKAVRVRLPGG
jgi:predicted ATPase/DNA-binding SARP family transcriptional activator